MQGFYLDDGKITNSSIIYNKDTDKYAKVTWGFNDDMNDIEYDNEADEYCRPSDPINEEALLWFNSEYDEFTLPRKNHIMKDSTQLVNILKMETSMKTIESGNGIIVNSSIVHDKKSQKNYKITWGFLNENQDVDGLWFEPVYEELD